MVGNADYLSYLIGVEIQNVVLSAVVVGSVAEILLGLDDAFVAWIHVGSGSVAVAVGADYDVGYLYYGLMYDQSFVLGVVEPV